MRRAHSKLALLLLGVSALAGSLSPGALLAGEAKSFIGPGATGYVGSEKCRPCHAEIYTQWSRTSHARMLRDAAKDRSAVAAVDFARVPFSREDIAWSIGSHREQKYLTFVDNDWYVLPKVWNLVADHWEIYSTFGWKEKAYTVWCAGCHTTGFDPVTKTASEQAIGCEACHGPGERHIAGHDRASIVNPDRLPKARHDMICEQCHTGEWFTSTGKRVPFPAGFRPGDDLSDDYTNFCLPKQRSNRWYWGKYDYKERHRMFLFEQEQFYSFLTPYNGITWQQSIDITPDERCGECHRKIFKAGKTHSRHAPAEAACNDCHVPTTTKDGQRYSVHDHKFDYSGPELPCAECHDLSDKTDRYFKDPGRRHKFRFARVKTQGPLTIPQACARCHKNMDVAKVLGEWKHGGD